MTQAKRFFLSRYESVLAAAGAGDLTKVMRFAESGEDCTIVDGDGQTALHLAAFYGHDGVVEFLAEKFPALADVRDHYDETPLHRAARNGKTHAAKFLAERFPVLVPEINRDGRTMLHLAAVKGHIEIVEFLADKFPGIAGIRGRFGDTALSWAASSSSECGVVVAFLAGKFPGLLDEQDNDGDTVLHNAMRGKSDKEVVAALLGHGADPTLKNGKGETPADLARQEEKKEIRAILLEGERKWNLPEAVAERQKKFHGDVVARQRQLGSLRPRGPSL